MSNRISGKAQRHSGIALLAASTILLAAAGETLWHANAAASEGRWAGPRVAVAASMMAAEAAAIAGVNAEANAMTVPDFKPFVMVRVPLPSGYTYGEVLGLNNSNQAVGWMWNDGAEIANAFFFDPAEGVTILATDEEDMDASWAFAISDENPPTIAGVVIWKGNPDYQRAALWDGPEDVAYTPFGSGVVSAAYGVKGVSSASTLAGMYIVSSEERSVVYVEGSGASYPATGVNGEARALNESGKVVGWHMVSSDSHAYSWVSNTTTDIHPSAYDASGAFAVNSAGHIGGWVDDEGEIIPAVWTFVIPGVYTVEPFDDVGADSVVTAINSHGEMAIMRTDATPGVAIWSKRTGVDDADLLDNVTLKPGGSDVLNSAWAINDNGWIGGSYLAGGTGDPQPCLIIPYDVDNNGTPDYREILEGKREGFTDLDTNDNWLLDAGELMRVGLHAAGLAQQAEGGLDPVQIVRSRANIAPREGARPQGLENEFYVDEIVNPAKYCEECEAFTEMVSDWGTGATRPGGQEDEQAEILIRLQSMMGENDEDWGDHEGLPASTQLRTEALEDIRTLAWRFAHCIDWMQIGNESYGGAEGYAFRYTDIPECTWDPEQGPNPYRVFNTLPSDECRETALGKVLEWQVEQAWAALEGSALAGRPLRITSSGVHHLNVREGYEAQDPDDVGRYLTTKVSEMCNANQMYFAMHIHYETVQNAEYAIKRLVGATGHTNPPWDVPNWRICTEIGAPAYFDHEWWSDLVGPPPGTPNAAEHWRFFDDSHGDPQFYSTWDSLVRAFAGDGQQSGQFTDGIQLDTVFGYLAQAGFAAVCHTALQYHIGESIFSQDRHLIEGIRATKVRDTAWLEDPTTRFTPVKGWYEAAGAGYKIEGFNPHPDPCDPSHTCPGCPQQ